MNKLMIVVAFLLSACGGRSLDKPGDANSDASTPLPVDLDPKHDAATAPAFDLASAALDANGCLNDGDSPFGLVATQLDAWNGKTARVVATEAIKSVPDGSRFAVDAHRVITNGMFMAACPKALKLDAGYPAIAVFIDVTGDGKCGPGDVGVETQQFGWSGEDLQGATTLPVTNSGITLSWTDTANLQGRLNTMQSFCASYFRD